MRYPNKACLILSILLLFTAIPFAVYGQETSYSLAEEGKLDKFFLGLGTANVNFEGGGALSFGLNIFGGADLGCIESSFSRWGTEPFFLMMKRKKREPLKISVSAQRVLLSVSGHLFRFGKWCLV